MVFALLVQTLKKKNDSTTSSKHEWKHSIEIGKKYYFFNSRLTSEIINPENTYINYFIAKNRFQWGAGIGLFSQPNSSNYFPSSNSFASTSSYSGHLSQVSLLHRYRLNKFNSRFNWYFRGEIYGNYSYQKGRFFTSENSYNDTYAGDYRINCFDFGTKLGLDLDYNIYGKLDINLGIGFNHSGSKIIKKAKYNEPNSKIKNRYNGKSSLDFYNQVGLRWRF